MYKQKTKFKYYSHLLLNFMISSRQYLPIEFAIEQTRKKKFIKIENYSDKILVFFFSIYIFGIFCSFSFELVVQIYSNAN